MRSGAAAGHEGCFHETGFYSSDDEYVALALPYLRDALEAGEPMYVTCSPASESLIRRAMVTTDGITFVPAGRHYARPAVAIREYRDAFTREMARGVPQIRVLAEVPHPGLGVPWDAWRRYETAANLVYNEFPVWGLCPYDLRTAPADVVEDARRAHPMLATPDGDHQPNPMFMDPDQFLRDQLASAPSAAIDTAPPDAELRDPTPQRARHVAARIAARIGLAPDDTDDLVTGVSEAVTNAYLHGARPVTVRMWGHDQQVVVRVHDCGSGPEWPLAGLVPAPGSDTGGYGLWILHQLVDSVSLHCDGTGFTVRLASGVVPDAASA